MSQECQDKIILIESSRTVCGRAGYCVYKTETDNFMNHGRNAQHRAPFCGLDNLYDDTSNIPIAK